METTLIKTKDLCKKFSNEGIQNNVLSHINLEIKRGDFTVIMGSSGSGKSTLLYALSGMDNITGGKVFYHEKDISKLKERELVKLRSKDFGFIFQQIHLISNLTIFENIVIHGYLVKEDSEKAVNERTKKLAEDMGIGGILKRYPSQISGGEQQRTAVARALISGPEIVFADEPTGALNKKSGMEVLDLLTDVNRKGQSVLMVTHDLRASIRGNRILYLEDGNICGEKNLPPYTENEIMVREKQVTSWLSGRGW